MSWKFQNPKSGDVYDVEEQFDESSGRDIARDKALAKGYVPVIDVVNPKTGDIHTIDDRTLETALAKGYRTTSSSAPRGQLPEGVAGMALSAAKGFADTATFGFADEIAGAYTAVANRNADESLKDAYTRGRDRDRALSRESFEVNPGSTLIGTAGAIIPTLAAAATTAVPTLANLTKLGAVEGAAYGAGNSEAEVADGDLVGLAADTAKGAAFGAATAAGGELLSRGASKGYRAAKELLSEAKPVESATKVVSNLAFDLPEQYTDAILKNPGKFSAPKSSLSLQDEAVAAVNNLRKELADADSAAWNTLTNRPVAIAEDFTSGIDDVLLNNRVVRRDAAGELIPSNFKQDVQALRKVEEIRDELRSLGNLSEKDLKSVIQKIDNETDWDKQDAETANKVLQSIRVQLDSILKGKNPGYAKAMEQVAPKAELLQNIVKDLRLVKGKAGFEATDTTLSKIRNLTEASGNVKKPQSEKALKELSRFRGTAEPLDLVEDINLSRIDAVTNAGATNGSRSTLAGSLLGAGVGGGIGYANDNSFAGAAAGAALGFAKDKYGRRIGKALLEKSAGKISAADRFLNQVGKKLPSLPAKYRRLLQSAATRGANATAITHFLLQQRDPEYRTLVNGDDD